MCIHLEGSCTRSVPVPNPHVSLTNPHQVLCGEIPFADITNDIRVVFAVKDGQRPERAQQISQVNWEFIQQCWNSQPFKRPLLPAIHEFLEQSFETPCYDGIEAAAAGIWVFYPQNVSESSQTQ